MRRERLFLSCMDAEAPALARQEGLGLELTAFSYAPNLEEAAQLAVYYSQARDGGKTQVDYTMVRNVRKPSGSLPGMVIYTDYATLSVSADEALAEKLRVK